MRRSRKDQPPAKKSSRCTASEPESSEELDDLEEWTEEDAIDITHEPADEEAFDVRLHIAVGGIEKAAVTSALEAPLQREVERIAPDLRWQRVVVTFSGDVMIPTAAKDVIGRVLPTCKPLSVTVQRGYRDEVVHEGQMPTVRVQAIPSDGGTEVRVEIDTAGVDDEDLLLAFRPELDKLCTSAADKSLTFCFTGGPAPAPALLRDPLVEAGATRVVLETDKVENVLFDRVLEELITVNAGPDADAETVVEVASGQDPSTTTRALAAVLLRRGDTITRRRVRMRFADGAPRSEEIDCLISLAAELHPTSLELADGDVLWPAMLQAATRGNGTVLEMEPGTRQDIPKAFQRELGALSGSGRLEGQAITLDWPAGMAVDQRLEVMLLAARPSALAYTFAGEGREPIWPAPLSFRNDGDVLVCDLDTEAGKPVELVPAIERHLQAQDLAGEKVDIRIGGEGTVSRSMRRALIDGLKTSKVAQARLLDHGTTEFLLPDLFAFETRADGNIKITVSVADRDDAEVIEAATAELEAHELPRDATILLQSTPQEHAIVQALVTRGVSRVVLEGEPNLQVHPALFANATRNGDDLSITATPDADDATLLCQVEHEMRRILEEQSELSSITVTLSWHGSAEPDSPRAKALETLLAAGPAVLRLDDGQGKVKQLHPEIIRSYVDVLGRREAGSPPMIIIGVDTDDVAGANTALETLAGELAERRVLVVFRDDEREITATVDNPVVQATMAFLESRAQAVLLFQQATRTRPAHFEVVSSKLEGLAVGARMRDPRG